jgi:hypothetical protein
LESGRIDNLDSIKTQVAESIDRLRKMPSLAKQADLLTAQLLAVMQSQYELIQDVDRAQTITFSHSRLLKENLRAFESIMSDFSRWIASDEARQYGIVRSDR